MKTYYTLQSVVIPQSNIIRSFVSTCKFKEVVSCGRCGGTGSYGNYGICYECEGKCKVVKISRGYTEDQLILEIAKNEAVESLHSANMAKNKSYEDELEKRNKKALKIKAVIIKGGNGSEFSKSLSELVFCKLTTPAKSLTEKQMVFVMQFLKAGCEEVNWPFDKVAAYLKSFN